MRTDGVFRFSRQGMERLAPGNGGWRDNRVALGAGDIRFRIGAIGHDISVTRSDCRSRNDFFSNVEQAFDVGILAFGLAGVSRFGFDGRDPDFMVRPGDVWLFRGKDTLMQRHTPAQPRATMVAVKFAIERVDAALDTLAPDWRTGGSRAVRLGRTPAADDDLRALLDNPLASAVDGLLAESQALGLLARWLAPLPDRSHIDNGRLGSVERRGIARVVDALTSDICHPPSLTDLAVLAGMSHTRLNRCFHKAYGKTVFAWLRDYRLDLAVYHLRQDRHSVTEIAYLCGFSSSSHFAAAFRERFACAPQQYRRREG